MKTSTTNNKRYLTGVLCYMAVLACFCVLSLRFEAMKGNQMPPVAQFGVICLLGTALLVPWVLLFFRKELKQAQLKLYPLRALVSIVAMVVWVQAVQHFGASQSVLLLYLTTTVAALMAVLIGREKLQWPCLAAGILCYAVIIPIFMKDERTSWLGLILALLSPVCWAMYDVICKIQSSKEHFLVQVFYTFFFAALFLSPISIKYVVALSYDDFYQLGIISALRIFNVIFLFLAIKLVTLNWLIPTTYLQFPMMAAIGFFFFDKPIKSSHWAIATVLVGINVIMMLIHNRRPTLAK